MREIIISTILNREILLHIIIDIITCDLDRSFLSYLFLNKVIAFEKIRDELNIKFVIRKGFRK